MLVHLPGQKKNETCDLPVTSYDLLPTLADLCDAPVDGKAELDGMSLKPILTEKNQPALAVRDLFWHKASQRPTSTGDYVSTAIRSGHYKLLDFYQQNRVELYDLQSDPGENHNLATERPEITRRLMQKLDDWRKEMNVKMADPSTMNHDDSKQNPGNKTNADKKYGKKNKL